MKNIKLKSWVRWLLCYMILADVLLVVIYLYMIRLIEIGAV